MPAALQQLLHHPALWRGDQCAATVETIPSGFAELDALLPGGGWPRGALTELLLERPGIGELRLILPALAELTRSQLWVIFVTPPYLPYAPALANAGIDLARFVIVHAIKDKGWAAVEALASGACGAVVCWRGSANERELRRLQLAAEEGRTAGLLFRPARWRHTPPLPRFGCI